MKLSSGQIKTAYYQTCKKNYFCELTTMESMMKNYIVCGLFYISLKSEKKELLTKTMKLLSKT